MEPSPARLSNSISVYFFATRPAFLAATLAGCMLGWASAAYSGAAIHPLVSAIALLLALLVHAAVNVLNDYFDALNGTDACNVDRLYPFTGGSRFIQNGVLTAAQTRNFGYVLLATVVLGGLWLTWQVGYGLFWIGAFGVFVGWAYSASPLQLNSRGLGELCVFLGFLGLVVGMDYVQRRSFSTEPILLGVAYALLATNLLYINQFPDRKADEATGKRNLVVRLPLASSIWLYLLLAILALAWMLMMVWLKYLHVLALLSLLPLLFSLRAFALLRRFAAHPAKLVPAIKLTLASMLSHALLLTLIMFWNAR